MNVKEGLFIKTFSCKIYKTPSFFFFFFFFLIFQKETTPLIHQYAVILDNLNIDHSDGRSETNSPINSIKKI